MSKLQIAWFAGLDEKQAEHIRQRLPQSIDVLERLYKLLESKQEEALKSSKNDYDCPSWAYKAADKAGYVRALSEILTLINIEGMDV